MTYTASKTGLIGLMRTYASSLAPENIRVNMVHSTGVRTPMLDTPGITTYFEDHPEGAAVMRNARQRR